MNTTPNRHPFTGQQKKYIYIFNKMKPKMIQNLKQAKTLNQGMGNFEIWNIKCSSLT